MTDTERQQRFSEIESRLSALIQSLSDDLDPATNDLVTDFVDNREYGVSLEWLRGVVHEKAIRLTERQSKEFASLATMMGISLGDGRPQD